MKRTATPALVLILLFGKPVPAAEVQVGTLSDIHFGQVPPTAGELESQTSFCVSVDPRGRYQLTGRGDGPGGSFTLTGGAGSTGLDYRVFATDRGRRLGSELLPGQPLVGQRGNAPRGNGACRRPFGQITVRIEAATLLRARPGRYRGTLSLTVAPE